MCFMRQFTTINLQWAISCNEFKSRCLSWPGVHFIFTVTSVTVLIRIARIAYQNSFSSLSTKQSSFDSIPFCNVYFATSAQNRCRRHVCGGGGAWRLHGR